MQRFYHVLLVSWLAGRIIVAFQFASLKIRQCSLEAHQLTETHFLPKKVRLALPWSALQGLMFQRYDTIPLHLPLAYLAHKPPSIAGN